MRTVRLQLRLSPNEATMLRELAEHSGLSMADIIRTLVLAEHRRTIPTTKPKKKGRTP